MKKLTYRVSSITNRDENTYYINMSDKHPDWFYTYRMTEEGFIHFLSIAELAGYEIKEEAPKLVG